MSLEYALGYPGDVTVATALLTVKSTTSPQAKSKIKRLQFKYSVYTLTLLVPILLWYN